MERITTSLGLAFAAGVAAVVLIGATVTALAEPWIEFSLFVGIPAGIGAGTITAAGVYLGLASDAPTRRRRVAAAFGGFGAGFLVALVVLAGFGMGVALAGSVVVGLLGAVASVRWINR